MLPTIVNTRQLASAAVLLTVAATALPASAGGVFSPSPVVFITYDNAASMDFAVDSGTIPVLGDPCDSNVEYARTRHVVAMEALTGTLVEYCPIEEERNATSGSRDDGDPFVHPRWTASAQRNDGLIDIYSDQFFFGLGTFDARPSSAAGEVGDYSFGVTYTDGGMDVNLGLANEDAGTGGLVSPLPPGWLPPTPGALTTYRVENNGIVQGRIANVVPGAAKSLSAAFEDLQRFRHLSPGVLSDPFLECRPFVNLLVTDGDETYDYEQCRTAPGGAPASVDCTDYATAYPNGPLDEIEQLATGEDCEDCPIGTFDVGTYVVSYGINEGDISANELAIAADTCAFLNEDGDCLEDLEAFRIDDHTELSFALGTVFNQFLDGELSMVPALTSTLTLGGEIGLVRFRASSLVSHNSPYWSGRLSRELFTCQEPEEGEPEVLLPDVVTNLHDQYDADFVSERVIYTGRLDLARDGASCARPACSITDTTIGLCDSVFPAPSGSGTHGDGTGGMDSGGANLAEEVTAPESVADCSGLGLVQQLSYDTCELTCILGDDDCVCDCETWFGCGTCGYEPAPPACDPLLYTTCSLTCFVLGLVGAECDCYCEELYGCGTCAAGPPPGPVATETNPLEIVNNLMHERALAPIAGNDGLLPEIPVGLDFDLIDIGDTCTIPFDANTFTVAQDLTDFLFSSGQTEAELIVEFTRGATLSSLTSQLGLLGIFDPLTLDVHDRGEEGYLGDFLHTQMALLGQPSPDRRSSPGYAAFVQSVGTGAETPRPAVLFAGSNDGRLYAFDAVTGAELWSFIPPSFLLTLRELMVSHRITVDGPITVRDVICDGATETWCTILAVSYRAGGSGALVLDVTDPTAPVFLFEVTGNQIPELGLGYPAPLIGNVIIDGGSGPVTEPVLVLSGGRPLSGPEVILGNQIRGSHEGETIVIMNAITGQVYRQFNPVSDPDTFAQCGPVTGTPAGHSRNLMTRIFAGTRNGCMLRVDTSSIDPDEWTMEVLYQTVVPGEISFAPAITTNPDGTLVVVFGHGNLEEAEHVNQQGSLVSVSEDRVLIDPAEEEALSFFELGSGVPNYEIVLEPGEMLTTAPIVSDNTVYVGSWVPSTDPCDGGNSRLYTIDYLGDTSVDGADATNPHVVELDSGRILGNFPNPAYDAILAPSEPTHLKFLGESYLGTNTAIFSVSIEPVPSCATYTANIEGEDIELAAGATTRQLVLDVIANAGGGPDLRNDPEAPDGPTPIQDLMSILHFEQPLSNPSYSAVPLDWGVVLEY